MWGFHSSQDLYYCLDFWPVTQCNLTWGYMCFGATHSQHLQGWKTDMVSPLASHVSIFIPILMEQKFELSREESSYFNPEDRGSELIWDFLLIKSTICTNFTNLFWHESLHVSCQNKFVKSVHLVGFINKKFVTMHSHMNIKLIMRCWYPHIRLQCRNLEGHKLWRNDRNMQWHLSTWRAPITWA